VATPLWTTAVLHPVAPGDHPATSTYAEHLPPDACRAVVTCTWEGRAGRARALRVLPDGCTDLAWDGTHLRVAPPVAGPVRFDVGGSAAHVGIRLRPAWAGPVLGQPAGTVAPGTRLADVVGPAGRAAVGRTEDALAATSTGSVRRAALVALVTALAASAPPPDPRVAAAADRLARGDRVTDASTAVGASPRHLRRLFADHVGLSPKSFQTVARFRRFLHLVRTAPVAGRLAEGETLARHAAACGYSDQAHLAHDCARLAGMAPRALRGPF
jgi:AraC-like DNA-binding protein